MPVIHLLHGFFVADGGKRTVAKLKPILEEPGLGAEVFSYGWVGLMGVWFLNPRLAKEFSKRVQPGDLALGHSNGCAIIHIAAMGGAPLSRLIYTNAALAKDILIPDQIEKMFVYFTATDSAVKFARWLRLLAPWAPLGDPSWGDMGAVGHGEESERLGSYPTVWYERAFFAIQRAALHNRVFRTLLKLVVGVPLVLVYWLVLAPIELVTTFVINNLWYSSCPGALKFSEPWDLKFIFYAGIVPCVIWGLFFLWI